ncbi:hypothetical protein [Amycolatopsis sp. NPDC052450]|uniref:hypothetical protein n=1 Tax=Amycolatopsis sp. NPDC052450 TaxID=3363937 RepID=UPI0037CC23B1
MPGTAQLDGRRFTAVAVMLNLVCCAVAGVTWTLFDREPTAGPSEVATNLTITGEPPVTPTATDEPSPTETSNGTESLPLSMERVNGPAGLETVIPRGWPTKTLSEPGSEQATDPADDRRIIKFGGAPPSGSTNILDYHLDYERKVAKRPGYVLHALTPTSVRDHDAVDWRFEWNAPEGRRHVRVVYWRTGGIEYFVYAHGPAASLPETALIVRAMVDQSAP